MFGEEGDVFEVAEEELGALDGGEGLVEGFGESGLEEAFLQACAHVAEEDFGEVGGFAGVVAAEEERSKELLFAGGGVGGGEFVERFGEILEGKIGDGWSGGYWILLGPESGEGFAQVT